MTTNTMPLPVFLERFPYLLQSPMTSKDATKWYRWLRKEHPELEYTTDFLVFEVDWGTWYIGFTSEDMLPKDAILIILNPDILK